MNSGIGVMGPYNHANATIGRAYGLLSQNLQGGSVPGETYMGSLGNGTRTRAAFAEAEERSPWEPFHVQHGFEPTRQHRRASSSAAGTRMSGLRPARHLAGEVRGTASPAVEQYSPPLLVIDPIVGARLRRARLRHQGEAHRLVRRERAADRARVLGQHVDAVDRAAARGRRCRALRGHRGPSPTSSSTCSSRRHQRRRDRRRDAADLEDDLRLAEGHVSVDEWR